MERQTGIAYFHLIGGSADEKVVSATLSVEGGFIASQHAYISDFAFAPTKDLTDITITFDAGTAPKASNFQLWFNVLPTEYTKMTLTVETTGHTMTISRNAPEKDEYLAGKLYKVVKEIPADKWEEIKHDTIQGGSKIIKLRGRSSFQSPAYQAVKMIEAAMGGAEFYWPAGCYVNCDKCGYKNVMMAMPTVIDKDGVHFTAPEGTPEEMAALSASYEHLCKMRDEIISLGIIPPVAEWKSLNPNL